ncbi:B3 domain-containing protein Os01g0234100 isoform X2 [Triticum aestivum]|uniref:B3 domain-containing protein Os01g0234100 isoform X2 n=1 Tax=Triticum aestivum TaxID=4565 RepID=UPI001D01D441|nr:B3 domain-containing protein Os01g0234100-like isoform X2 [Triticum aestivum]
MAMIVFDAWSSSAPPPTHEHDKGLALAIIADQQNMGVDECDDPESKVDYVPLNEEELALTTIAGQQPTAADECGDPESEVDFVPLRVVRPDDEQPKHPGGRVKVCAHKPRTKKVKRTRLADSKSDKGDNFAPMGKRGRPTRAKSAKSKTWCNTEFVYGDNINISSSSESDSEGNKDADYNPTRKTGRLVRAKSVKSNMWRKPEFVYGDNLDISSSASETEGNKDDDYDPMASDIDGHPKKCARSRGRPTRAKSAKSKMWRKPEFVNSDNINISSNGESESERNKDDDYDPTAPDADGHRQKYASSHDIRGSAFERASEVMKKLTGKGASFIKLMQPSHVDRVFWLGIPRKFCKEHLPEKDTLMTLEDEEGRSYNANYLVARDGLSGGWKNFAERHSLKVDDTLVFRLVSSEKFKVYIVRENELTTTDDNVNSKEEDPNITTGVSGTRANDDSNNEIDLVAANDDGLPSVENMRLRALASKMATVQDALKAVNEEVGELELSVKKAVQAVRRMTT